MRFIKPALCLCLLFFSAFAFGEKLRQVAILDIPGRPGFDTLAFANNYLIIAHNGAGTVDIFDPARRRLVAHINGIGDARGVATDNGRIYIADYANRVIDVISAQNWHVEDQIALQNPPDALIYVPETKMLVATNPGSQTISVIATDPIKDVQTIPIDGRPEAVVFDPQRKTIYLSVQDRNELLGYSLDSIGPQSKPVQKIDLIASQPTGLVFDSNARRIYVAVRYAVLAIDPDSGSEVNRVPTAGGTDTLWFDRSGSTLIAGATDGTVTVMKVTGGRLVSDFEMSTSVKGHALAFDPDKKLVYVPGGYEGKSKLVILKEFGGIPNQESDENKTAAIKLK